MKLSRIFVLLSALLVSLKLEAGELRLHHLLSDHAVLQRNSVIPVVGWGKPGATVQVSASWHKKPITVKVEKDGSWAAGIPTWEAQRVPQSLEVSSGKERIILSDLLIGEVWICSGQSNMEMPLGGWDHQRVQNAYETIRDAASATPLVRMFTVQRNNADTLQEDCGGSWQCSTPAAVRHFSATAYHFGKTLSQFMPDVPIGLVATDWGGTPIEAWLSVEALENTPGIDVAFSKTLHWGEVTTGQLFNGMIYPLRNYPARGFIWYQGEANLDNPKDYPSITVSMVNEWRALWRNPDMPYYLVQIAPYSYDEPDGFKLPVLVENQYRIPTLLEHCGIASTTDIGHKDCIHPPFKKEVGERLAWLALANDYGFGDIPVTPTYKSVSFDGAVARVSFNGVSTVGNCWRMHGLHEKMVLGGFELAGEDHAWHTAQASVDWNSNDILVHSDEVPAPVAVRYAWHNWPAGANVVTDYGLPLPPFRSVDW